MIVRRFYPRKGVDRFPAPKSIFLGTIEYVFQPLVECILSHGGNQACRVLRHKKRVLNGITLLEASPCLGWVEFIDETAICFFRMNEFFLLLKNLLPAVTVFQQLLVISLPPHILCHLSRSESAE